jgi:hypothetical protein
MNVLSDRPAYQVTTHAYEYQGADYGTQTVTVTEGKVAQSQLMYEPAERTARRIAQGIHTDVVRADGGGHAVTGKPTIVKVLAIVNLSA